MTYEEMMILTEQHLESQVSEHLLRADFVKALMSHLPVMPSAAVVRFSHTQTV